MIHPAEDAYWPKCPQDCRAYEDRDWCDHVADIIREGKDRVVPDTSVSGAQEVSTTLTTVPIRPQFGVFAQVKLLDEVNPERLPGVRRLAVVLHKPMVPGYELEEIALWTPGEGRASICMTIIDWMWSIILSNQMPDHAGLMRCPCSLHQYKEEMAVMRISTEAEEVLHNFACVFHGACVKCFRAVQKLQSTNFLDPDDPSTPGSQAARSRLGMKP